MYFRENYKDHDILPLYISICMSKKNMFLNKNSTINIIIKLRNIP